MTKRSLWALLAIFIAWSAMDFVLHGVLLMSSYEETAPLWRPMPEMKMGLINFTVLVSAFIFVYVYYRFFAEKTLGAAVKWGVLFGVSAGFSMGIGIYAVMPIPESMSMAWVFGTIAEGLVGGLLLGLIARPPGQTPKGDEL